MGVLGKLNVKQVARAIEPGRYGDGGGLYLQVVAAAKGGLSRSWIFRYVRQGRERQMGLGPIDIVPLDEAREQARVQRRLLLDGGDPIEDRERKRQVRAKAAAKVKSFEDAAREYCAAHKAEWNPKHAADTWSRLERLALPQIGKLGVADIDTDLLFAKVLEPIWTTKTTVASLVRGHIEQVLDWAKTRGYRTGDNPARWSGNLSHLLSAPHKIVKVEHHPSLPYADISAFMLELGEKPGMPARALELLILSGLRTSEARAARWSEFDLEAKRWTIPAERMKARKTHVVPLSDRAVALLEALPRIKDCDFVFPGIHEGECISDMSMFALLRRMKRKDITVHGFRATFRTWAAERTAYPREVCEMALAHTVGEKVEQAYQRSDLRDLRSRLMADWAAYCSSPPQQGGANVTPIRKRA